MSTTIESLEIELQSDSTSAEQGVDALVATLTKLKSTLKGGLGGATVSKQLTALTTSANSITADTITKLTELTGALGKLQALGDVKISSSIPSQLTKLGSASKSMNVSDFDVLTSLPAILTPLSELPKSNLSGFVTPLTKLPVAINALNGVNFTGVREKLTSLTSSLVPLEQLGKSNLSSFINQINKLPKMMETLKGLDMRTLYNQIQALTRIFQPLATEMQKVANGFSAFPTKIQKMISSNTKLEQSNKRTSLSFAQFTAKLGLLYLALKRVGQFLAQCIVESNNYGETLNLATSTMGEYFQEALDYATLLNAKMGIDPAEWLKNQSVLMAMGKGFGLAEKQAYDLSESLTELTYDISSLYNESLTQSAQRLQSALAGEIEPIRRTGIAISQANLQEYAWTKGITESVSAMTEQEKALLRSLLLIESAGKIGAIGDFEKTLSSPANAIRILQQNFTELGRAIGNVFIPTLVQIMPYLQAVVRALTAVFNIIASLFGFELPEWDTSSWDAMGAGGSALEDSLDSASGSAKEIKKQLLGIDELNVFSSPSDSGGGAGGGGGGANWADGLEIPDLWDKSAIAEIQTKTNDILNGLKDWLGITDGIDSWSELFQTRLGKILILVGAIMSALALWKIAKGVAGALSVIETLCNSIVGKAALAGLGLGLITIGVALEFDGIKDAIKNGLNGINFAEIITGGAGIITGGALMGKALGSAVLGGAIGAIVAGVPAFFLGVWDAIKNGLNWLNGILITAGATVAGAGIGAIVGMLGGPIGAGIGALIGLAVGLLTDGVIWLVQTFGDDVSRWWTGKVVPFFADIGKAISNCVTNIKKIITDKWNAIVKFVQNIPQNIKKAIDEMIDNFVQFANDVAYSLGECLASVVIWCTDTYSTMHTEIPKTIEAVKTWFAELPDKIKTAISSAITNIGTWCADMKQTLSAKITDIITSVTTWFAELPTKIYNAIIGTIEKVTTWGTEMKTKISTEVAKLVTAFVDGFKTLPSKLGALGTDIWNGLKNGVTKAFSGVKNFASGLANSFTQGFKGKMEIHSPSRVFETLGKFTIEGYNVGLQKTSASTQGVLNKWANSISNVSPDLAVNVDTSQIQYYNSNAFRKTIPSPTLEAEGFESAIATEVHSGNTDMVVAIVSAIQALQQSVENKDSNVYISDDSIGQSVVRYADRRTQLTGMNPITGW